MLLNNGITGVSDDKTLLPMMSCYEFKRICYEIATSLKFNIENFDFKLEGKNFYSAKVKINNDTIFILLNAYYPIIAFALKISPFNNEYLDIEMLSNEFIKFYHILTVSELESSITNEEKECLNDYELKQLKYYKPDNVAGVIFNYWD